MSLSSKSRFTDRKAGKELQKSPSGHMNSGKRPVNRFNSLLGKYHAPSEEIDDQIFDTGFENDPVSNQDSLSVKSEDTKDKPSQQTTLQESIPGAENEKREKIRQKNEKKHQRQKEKRAQELYEKCCSFLMSRKLQTLTETLVAMGFPLARATRSLIMTKGKIEQSIVWLLESTMDSAEGSDQPNLGNGNLKIDISEELTQMANIAFKNSCSKQDIEKAVIACEGDLEKVAETFLLPSPPVKAEETPLKSEEALAEVQNSMKAVTVVSNVTGPKLEWAKPKAQNVDLRNVKFGSVNEPVVILQRPQSTNMNRHVASVGPHDNNYSQVQEQQHQQFEDVFNYSHVGAPLSVASSLGLFSGLGHPNGFKLSSSPSDWNIWAENLSGAMYECGDYTRVDWAVNLRGSSGLRMTGMSQRQWQWQDDNHHHQGFDITQAGGMSVMEGNNGGGLVGEMVVNNSGEEESSGGVFREWSNPFEGNDLLSHCRQFVMSASL